MASFIGILALAIGTFWAEASGLIRRRHIRELVVFIFFLLVATALYGALTLGVKIPNILYSIKLIYKAFV